MRRDDFHIARLIALGDCDPTVMLNRSVREPEDSGLYLRSPFILAGAVTEDERHFSGIPVSGRGYRGGRGGNRWREKGNMNLVAHAINQQSKPDRHPDQPEAHHKETNYEFGAS